MSRIESLKEKYKGTLTPDSFEAMLESDPTPKKVYLQWLLEKRKNGNIDSDDERTVRRLHGLLSIFDENKKQAVVRDIGRIANTDELERIVSPFFPPPGDEIKTIYDGEHGSIKCPLTEKAAKYLSRGTNWCTATGSYSDYIRSHLYVMRPANPIKSGELYQFYPYSGEFCDWNDDRVTTFPYEGLMKELFDSIPYHVKEVIVNFGSNSEVLKWLQLDDDLLLKYFSRTKVGKYLKYVDNPSMEVQLAAVKSNWQAIGCIKNPSKEMQLLAIYYSAKALSYILNPDEEIACLAIEKDPVMIARIFEPTEAMLEAFKKGLDLRKNKSKQDKDDTEEDLDDFLLAGDDGDEDDAHPAPPALRGRRNRSRDDDEWEDEEEPERDTKMVHPAAQQRIIEMLKKSGWRER